MRAANLMRSGLMRGTSWWATCGGTFNDQIAKHPLRAAANLPKRQTAAPAPQCGATPVPNSLFCILVFWSFQAAEELCLRPRPRSGSREPQRARMYADVVAPPRDQRHLRLLQGATGTRPTGKFLRNKAVFTAACPCQN